MCLPSVGVWRCAHVEHLLKVEGFGHCLLAVVQSRVPGMQEEHEAELTGGVALEGILDGDKVL